MKKIIFFAVVLFSMGLTRGYTHTQDDPTLIDKIFISPATVSIPYAGDVYFRAYAYDKDGNHIENFKPTFWQASAGIIYPDGHYVGNISGWHTVDAVYTVKHEDHVHLVTGEASIHVGF